MYANYYSSTVVPEEPADKTEPSSSYCTITPTGTNVIRYKGSKILTSNYFDSDGNELPDVESYSWKLFVDDVMITDEEIQIALYDGNPNKIRLNLVGNQFVNKTIKVVCYANIDNTIVTGEIRLEANY